MDDSEEESARMIEAQRARDEAEELLKSPEQKASELMEKKVTELLHEVNDGVMMETLRFCIASIIIIGPATDSDIRFDLLSVRLSVCWSSGQARSSARRDGGVAC